MFKDFQFTLNIGVRATTDQEALEIAEEIKRCIEAHSAYKTRFIEIDDVEEA